MSGYWPQNTMSRIAPEIAVGPPTGFSENFDALWQDQVKNNNPMSRYNVYLEAYADRVRDIYAKTGKKLVNPMLSKMPSIIDDAITGRSLELRRQAIEDFENDVAVLRKDHPDIVDFTGMISSISDVAHAVDAHAGSVFDRATGFGMIGALAGGMAGSLADPFILSTLPFGAARGQSILRTALTEAGIAGATELVVQPQIQDYRTDVGLDAGIKQAAVNVSMAAGGGAIIGGGVRAAEVLVGRPLLKAFDEKVKSPTMNQKEARDIYERIVDESQSNPFDQSIPEADSVHSDNMREAYHAMQDNRPARVHNNLPGRDRMRVEEHNLDGIIYSFDPDHIAVDAKTFQFKAGGDNKGVTERLRDIGEWDPVKAGQVIVYEYSDGRQFIADGHQRLGLAQRLKDSGDKKIRLYGHLFREEDGFTPEDIRTIAALKNIAEGTGTVTDAAKVLRADPHRVGELPPRSVLVRQAVDLVNLTDDAFGMVVNEIVPANFAAIVGRLVPADADLQRAVLDVLSKTDPVNAVQAESIVRQVIDSGIQKEIQTGLFGEEEIASSLFVERAKILDKALKKLRSDHKIFDTLVRNEDSITSQGNILQSDVNARLAAANARGVAIVQKLTNRKGVLSDALTMAARRAANDGRYTQAVIEFTDSIRRSVESGDFTRDTISGTGRLDEIVDENPALPGQPGEKIPNDQVLLEFDDPAGRGQEIQSRALENELEAEFRDQSTDDLFIPTGEKVDPDTGDVIPEVKTVRQIMDDLDQDAADIDAIGKCGKT